MKNARKKRTANLKSQHSSGMQKGITPLRTLNQPHSLQCLRELDWTSSKIQSQEESFLRRHTFRWVNTEIKLSFQFRDETIQHATRLYDRYSEVASPSPATDFVYEAFLLMMTCVFMSVKYNEIYPPSVLDLSDYLDEYADPVTMGRRIVLYESKILCSLSYNLNLPLVSHWYNTKYGGSIPKWSYACYTELSPDIPNQAIADSIWEVVASGKVCVRENCSNRCLVKSVVSCLKERRLQKSADTKVSTESSPHRLAMHSSK